MKRKLAQLAASLGLMLTGAFACFVRANISYSCPKRGRLANAIPDLDVDIESTKRLKAVFPNMR